MKGKEAKVPRKMFKLNNKKLSFQQQKIKVLKSRLSKAKPSRNRKATLAYKKYLVSPKILKKINSLSSKKEITTYL